MDIDNKIDRWLSTAADPECQSRDSGDAFHVGYTINEDSLETENTTNTEVIHSDEIAERGDSEVGWIVQFKDPGQPTIQLFMSDEIEMGWTIKQEISPQTAMQLSDMFARIGVLGLERAAQIEVAREARAREDEEIAKRQQVLPMEAAEYVEKE